MRGIVLASVILLATAAPAAGQMAFGVRAGIGAAYTEKGGAGSGFDAHGEPDSGTISTSYLQFSMLLRARAFWTSERSPSMVFLAGPWVGSQMSCEKEGDQAVDCEGTDAGIALGAGVEHALPGSSSASVGLKRSTTAGLREHSGYEETTRFAGVEVGFAYKIG